MARTIAISDEVYELLKRSKFPGESFSAVIKRSLQTKRRLSEVVGSGTIGRADWEDARVHLLMSESITTRKLRESS